MTNSISRLIFYFFCSTILFGSYAEGQDHTPRSTGTESGYLTVLTDIDSAAVFLDSTRLGVTPLHSIGVPPGKYKITILHPDHSNWLSENINDTLQLLSNESRTLRYIFPKQFLIGTEPDGATVFVNDSSIGMTPLFFRGEPGARSITFRKSGFRDTTASISALSRGSLLVPMKKEWNNGPLPDSPLKNPDAVGTSHLNLYITGAATILSGVAAAYWKVEADKRYNEFLISGNPAVRAETRRLDTAATIALITTQLGLGTFIYFILSE